MRSHNGHVPAAVRACPHARQRGAKLLSGSRCVCRRLEGHRSTNREPNLHNATGRTTPLHCRRHGRSWPPCSAHSALSRARQAAMLLRAECCRVPYVQDAALRFELSHHRPQITADLSTATAYRERAVCPLHRHSLAYDVHWGPLHTARMPVPVPHRVCCGVTTQC